MVGMSGVGKTETALALADELYGGPQNLTTINMSEFKEEHKVSMLVGSPPGYVGFGEGGVLTEAVRRRPYGVLLLDEMDKAHPGVQDVFYQLFDKGSLRDGEGRDIDFKNTAILMTANTGSEVLAALSSDPDTMPESEALSALLKDALLAQFKPAFLGRITVLPYLPLDCAAMEGIVEIQLNKVRERVTGSYGGGLSISAAARKALVDAAMLGEAGARAIEAKISRELLPALAAHFLASIPAGTTREPVDVDVAAGGFVVRGRNQARKAKPESGATPAESDTSRPQAGPRDPATPHRAPKPGRVPV
jgi:type VI secretion system protein VasG